MYVRAHTRCGGPLSRLERATLVDGLQNGYRPFIAVHLPICVCGRVGRGAQARPAGEVRGVSISPFRDRWFEGSGACRPPWLPLADAPACTYTPSCVLDIQVIRYLSALSFFFPEILHSGVRHLNGGADTAPSQRQQTAHPGHHPTSLGLQRAQGVARGCQMLQPAPGSRAWRRPPSILAVRTDNAGTVNHEDKFLVVKPNGQMRSFAGTTRPTVTYDNSGFSPDMVVTGNYKISPRPADGKWSDAFYIERQNGDMAVPTAKDRNGDMAVPTAKDRNGDTAVPTAKDRNGDGRYSASEIANPVLDDEIRLHPGNATTTRPLVRCNLTEQRSAEAAITPSSEVRRKFDPNNTPRQNRAERIAGAVTGQLGNSSHVVAGAHLQEPFGHESGALQCLAQRRRGVPMAGERVADALTLEVRSRPGIVQISVQLRKEEPSTGAHPLCSTVEHDTRVFEVLENKRDAHPIGRQPPTHLGARGPGPTERICHQQHAIFKSLQTRSCALEHSRRTVDAEAKRCVSFEHPLQQPPGAAPQVEHSAIGQRWSNRVKRDGGEGHHRILEHIIGVAPAIIAALHVYRNAWMLHFGSSLALVHRASHPLSATRPTDESVAESRLAPPQGLLCAHLSSYTPRAEPRDARTRPRGASDSAR